MKLNFWQWVGLVVLIVGVALWLNEKMKEGKPGPSQQPTVPATTVPASSPSTTQP